MKNPGQFLRQPFVRPSFVCGLVLGGAARASAYVPGKVAGAYRNWRHPHGAGVNVSEDDLGTGEDEARHEQSEETSGSSSGLGLGPGLGPGGEEEQEEDGSE